MSNSITYLVTSKDELDELKVLMPRLISAVEKHPDDEILVLNDYSENREMIDYLQSFETVPNVSIFYRNLNNDFSAQKNFGTEKAKTDWIFQIDADEYPHDFLLNNIHNLLASNPSVDLYRVPRVNLLHGLTDEHAKKWGWHVSTLSEFPDIPVINWHNGDRQSRIYRKNENIRWTRRLHETIVGAKTVGELPIEVQFSLIHEKTIERQEEQNTFYNQNFTTNENLGKG
jgi:glycosyltransferase involved in cell wall biosynthesis